MDLVPEVNFTLNLVEQLDEIRALLSEKKYRDQWGYECGQYCLVDVQDTEIIVMDRADHYRLYGMQFSMDGDKITIDFGTATRKKTKYENFEGEAVDNEPYLFEQAITDVATFMSAQVETLTQDKNTAEENYTTLKNDYDEMKPKYDAYVLDEQNRQKAAIEAQKDAEFAKFDQHLSDDADYAQLKQDRDNYTLEEIQSKCAIMFTKKNLNANFTQKKGSTPTVSEVFEQTPKSDANSRYGVLPMKK